LSDDQQDRRIAEARRRAYNSLASLLPDPEPGAAPGGDDGWITVGEAAERSGLSTATIRQLYRSGAVPSRKRDGNSGPFVVPLDAVMAHVPEPSDDMDKAYWEDEARRARAECAALRAELDRVRSERDELRLEVEELREPVYRGPVRERAALRPHAQPAPEAEAEPEPEISQAPDAEPAPPTPQDGPRHDRRSRPRPSADDVVMPVDDDPKRGLFRRKK
jgi:hypothetical protein